MRIFIRALSAAAVAASLSCNAWGAGGPLGIDHRLPLDENGIWARSNQLAVQNISAVTVLGGALWEGNETRLGRTFWKASEAMLIADVADAGLKRVFRRPRPRELDDPNQWFRSGGSYRSFPSGEVTHISAIVTPFIAEYGRDHPAVWGLAALPLYVGAARLKSQAHWQTDVLAGAALGAGIGYYKFTRDSAWTATALPRGLTVGFHKQF
ncbi:phosphatase PAP2 family protein [Ramlibacter sp. MMS24-I3-19]|uniref:phosphatase PAP2 family protein n=1 Tax=Ramlibacter sp. MMS24-I3-19 TaxID=3416606 RepID=UPI003D08B5E5